MCGCLKQTPDPDILSHHHEKEFSQSVTVAVALCFPALAEGEKRAVERVASLSLSRFSQGDDWKADVTEWVGAS